MVPAVIEAKPAGATSLRRRRRWLLGVGLSTLLLVVWTGCMGVSANPFRLGNLPGNDIIRTHGKPPGWGYNRNFDPAAKCLTVTPLEDTNKVGTQHVLVASVCDENGDGRRNRRVEWHLTGVGHIVEVDESGIFPGRGYLVDDHYGVSYTNYKESVITRGNADPSDDIRVRPGQTWCVITSAEEGDSHVTVYAPGVHDWEKHKVFAIKHWVDASASFPENAVNQIGTPHQLTTKVMHSTDKTSATGYRVRYRIIDGPDAVFDPGGARQVEVIADPAGNATTILRQTQPVQGVNRILIEIVRPGVKGGDHEIVVAKQEMTKTWVTALLAVNKTGPATVSVGQTIPYQITVTNTGSVATDSLTIRDTVPPTLQLVGSIPQATLQGQDLFWTFGPLQPNQTITVQFACQATTPGTVTNCAEATTGAGISGKSCVTTAIVTGDLQVTKTGPASAIVGQPISFNITVTNRGNGPANNVIVTDAFDPGLVHETGPLPVRMPIGTLAPGESRSVPIQLLPRQPGKLCNQVSAVADNGLRAAGEHCVEVVQPQLSILKNIAKSKVALIGAIVDFEILVKNTGAIPAQNVLVRDQLPVELEPREASDGGLVSGNVIAWNLGTLAPGEERRMTLSAVARQVGQNVCNIAMISAEGGVNQQAPPACIEIRGVPAVLTEVIDRLDPVPVGGQTTYTIQVTNQGSIPLNNVVLQCQMPTGLEFVDAEGAVPFKYDATRRTVTFAPFSNMLPSKRLIYQVQARAVRPGDHRFMTTVNAAELLSREPLTKVESTQVYDPETGNLQGSTTPAPKSPTEPRAPLNVPLPPVLAPVGVVIPDAPSIPIEPPAPIKLPPAKEEKPPVEPLPTPPRRDEITKPEAAPILELTLPAPGI